MLERFWNPTRTLAACALLVTLATGCGRDLELPAEAQRGQVVGRLDTQGYASPVDRPVGLVREDGRRYETRTQSDGSFRFTDVLPGNYFVELSLANFAPMLRPGVQVRGATEVDVGALAPAWVLGSPSVGALSLRGRLADGTPSTVLAAQETATLEVSAANVRQFVAGSATLTPEACPGPNDPGWETMPSDGRISVKLEGTGAVRTAWVCLRTDVGAVVGPRVAVIGWDATPPTGCVLNLTGRRADGDPAPAGRTATSTVTVDVSSCGEPPTEIFFAGGPIASCAAENLPWQPFSPSRPWVLPGSDGLHTVHACVRDAARNAAGVATASITLDTQPPRAPFVTLDDGALYFNRAQLLAASGERRVTLTGSALEATEWAVGTSPSALGPFAAFPPAEPAQVTFAADGVQTAYAVFRDDVGNATAVASDSIVVDTQAPIAGTLSIVTPSANAFTSSVSVTLNVAAPADAAAVRLGVASSPAVCSTGGAGDEAVVPQRILLLPAGDGVKTVCVQAVDAAGNAGALASASVTLDTLAPSAPQLITLPQTLSAPDDTAFTVTTTGPVADANFARYERLGGKLTAWTVAPGTAATTSFGYNLVSVAGAEAGVANLLRLRAVDQAGNVSPEASVVVTTDINAPEPVTLDPAWVNNGSGQGTVHWQPSSSADVVGYKVYYGSVSGSYNGTGAQQGASPFRVGRVESATLSGLNDGAGVVVTVRPVDAAGNEGPAPGAPAEVDLDPDEVSPSPVATLALKESLAAPGLSATFKIDVQGDFAYLVGPTAGCSGGAALRTVDLGSLRSPVHSGRLDAATPAPVLGPTLLLPITGADCDVTNNHGIDFVSDGRWGYLGAGSRVYVLDLTDPMAPVQRHVLDLATLPQLNAAWPAVQHVHGLAQVGDVLFVGARPNGAVVAIGLGKLLDRNPATLPRVVPPAGESTDVLGVVSSGFANPTGLAASRDFLVQNSGGIAAYWRATDALDGNPATVWDNADLLGTGGTGSYGSQENPVVSGNWLYMGGYSQFTITSLNGQGGSAGATNLWTGGVPQSATNLARNNEVARFNGEYVRQLTVAGSQLLLPGQAVPSLVIADASDASAIRQQGLVAMGGFNYATATATYGPYLLVATGLGSGTSTLRIYETATPRSMHPVSPILTQGGGAASTVAGGFLRSPGTAVDLHDGSYGHEGSPDCYYDAAPVGEDRWVGAVGSQLRVWQDENAADRDPGSAVAARYGVNLPAGVEATGVAVYGGQLVVAERRIDGTWLEVFSLAAVRDRRADTSLTLAHAAGAVRVTPNRGRAVVTLHRGRAFVGLMGTQGPGLYVVDVRNLLDDDAATGVANDVTEGFFPAPTTPATPDTGVAQVVVRGTTAYMATDFGLDTLDVSATLDASPATRLQAPFQTARLATPEDYDVQAVAVYGGYAFIAPLAPTGQIFSVDVGAPFAPRFASGAPFVRFWTACSVDGVQVVQRAGLSVAGSRLYATTFGAMRVYDLE